MAIKLGEKITHVFPKAKHKEVLRDLGKAFGDDNGKVDGERLKGKSKTRVMFWNKRNHQRLQSREDSRVPTFTEDRRRLGGIEATEGP